ncbi:4'-phosphopantetheinyl transferase superfamily protein [Catellatospora sp. TT07R-123]|uniref:4'-phosphopantetheinyl transferase superfamily protein n=1 Tax=Catellatospora sp. TT07R-123 TaxID=2733863 RepID=UPI001BB3F1CD|nr:4'-phosphopantetheinyl transferase superfamily protein [Catellatospora sp. TT07R-123]
MPDHPVEVWLVCADLAAPVLSHLESVLDDAERARAAALTLPADRRRFVAAHAAMRCIVAARLGVAPGSVRWRRGEHGKPEVVGGPPVNMSRSGGLAAVAVGTDRPVGVDVQESVAGWDPVRTAARYFAADEAAYVARADSRDRFLRLWVRKEAYVKALGGRLWPSLAVPVGGDVAPGPVRITDLPAPAGFRAAVAVVGDRPYRTVVRRWAGATIPAVDRVAVELAGMLAAVTGEQAPITADTRLEQDLRLESIEVAELAGRVRQRWGADVDLAAFYADLEIDQIIGLTVGDLAFYVASRVGD